MINDISDLKKLLKLCRSQGVDKFKMGGIEIDFGAMPEKTNASSFEIESEEPDEETLMYWSSDKGQEVLDKKVGMR